MRSFPRISFMLCLFAVGLAAQQPNSASARLRANFLDHPVGGTGPVPVAAVPGGSFVITLNGSPLQRFILAAAPVITPGVNIGPLGILDIFFPFEVLLDGFNPSPTSPLSYFAATGPTGVYQISSATSFTASGTFGLQAGIADPANPAGGALSAAAQITFAPLTTMTTTIPESQLGDDVTVTYFHQALAFPFYGSTYGRTNIDTNGYVAFGPAFASEWLATTNAFLTSGPRLAPFWSDLHLSSTVQSTFGVVSQSPASIVVTESQPSPGFVQIQVDWLFATEAAVAGVTGGGTGNRYDFRCTYDSIGSISFRYGPGLGVGFTLPALGNTISYCGITSGGGLSANTASRDLVVGGAVSPFTAGAANDAIFERFDPTAAAFPIDLVAPTGGINFQPQSLAVPGNRIYSMF